MLSHTLARLPQSMRVSAHLAESLSQRIAITRDIALFSLAFYCMTRDFHLSFTLASRILRLPESAGLVFNFLFGKTLRKSVEAVVVLAGADHPQTCAFRGVTEYVCAALAISWNFSAGYLFPVVEGNGGRGSVAITAPRMTAICSRIYAQEGCPTTSRCTSLE